MDGEHGTFTVGVSAGSAFDLSIEREVFDGMDVTLRPVDIETTDDLISEFEDVDAVIDRLLAAPYTSDVIEALDQCQVIARCGVGVDNIDVDCAERHGIAVVNVPVYCQDEVSEHTILLMLALERDLVDYDSSMKSGVWEQGMELRSIHRLRGQTFGLVGFGTIARLVAEKAQAFGMSVIATDPYIEAAEMEQFGVKKVDFDTVLARSDTISLHTPLIEETEGMMDAAAFDQMKDSAYLINAARGGLVVEGDLLTVLREGDIAGAGLDVFGHEPDSQSDETPPFESPLRELDNVVLTPHVAWFSHEANVERRRKAAEDVRRVFRGKEPRNPVNEPR